ncbi:MAG: YkgJ family cysteine cluster protein [Nitrospirota bacterium]|nr:MAG: YkgJ family cysteine cluster protein [Nitrospirota bacterium]
MVRASQIVPSQVCLSCDVCCRFPERDSSFRPFFTASEIQQAIEKGIDARYFSDSQGSQVEAVPNPFGEGYLCPAFDPETSHCRIYDVRPLDCQIYPFVMMWDKRGSAVHLGWDTKCPFLCDQSSLAEIKTNNPTTARRSYALPENLYPFTQTMAKRVESPEMIKILSANHQLVMEFQEDVVVLQKLPRLTQILLSNRK